MYIKYLENIIRREVNFLSGIDFTFIINDTIVRNGQNLKNFFCNYFESVRDAFNRPINSVSST